MWTVNLTGRAHTHILLVERVTFRSCALSVAQDVLSFCAHFHRVPWCRSSRFFPMSPILTSGSRSRPSASTASMRRRSGKTLASPLAGVGCLADWLTQLQTQVMSPTPPTSSAAWSRSTRRSTSPTATSISSARTTLPWSPPQIQKVCRAQEHPAAASNQQLAEFPRCSDLQASGDRWQVMCRVDQASRKLRQFQTENLLQQRFLVQCRKGRDIEAQTLCIRRKTENLQTNRWTESWLGHPRRDDGFAEIVWSCGWDKKLGKEKIPTLLFRRSIKNLNLSDFNCTKQVDGQIQPRETRLVCMERNWEICFSKKIMQGIARKLKNWEVFVAKKLIEQDSREVMNCPCNNRWIPQSWVKWWLSFGNWRTKWIPCPMQENFMILNRGAVLERPTFPIELLRF